jgi:hypothetical protein
MAVDMAYLPEPGIYDWTFSVYFEALGDLCSHEGWFELLPDEDHLTGTAELIVTEEVVTGAP